MSRRVIHGLGRIHVYRREDGAPSSFSYKILFAMLMAIVFAAMFLFRRPLTAVAVAVRLKGLATSMPWTIRIALAVIWGVCWMFYPNHGDGKPADLKTSGSPLG